MEMPDKTVHDFEIFLSQQRKISSYEVFSWSSLVCHCRIVKFLGRSKMMEHFNSFK